MPALQEDTLGFANRLAAHRTTAKTRRAALANTPMATRDEGHNGCLFQANHALRSFEHFRKHRLQHGMNLWHGGPVLGSLTPTFRHNGIQLVGAIIWFRQTFSCPYCPRYLLVVTDIVIRQKAKRHDLPE